MITEDDVLLPREPWGDLGVEFGEALIVTEEEIPQMENGGIPGNYLLPTGDHQLFVLTRPIAITHDIFMVKMRVADNVKWWLKHD